MTRQIIPIFLPNRGCPQRCIFCNERITAGTHPEDISREDMAKAIALYGGNILPEHSRAEHSPERQIAFYGSNFTGMPVEDQTTFLEMAQSFIHAGGIDSIRISTRPDYIDEDRIDLLKRFYVRTVEVGVQSLTDKVLMACKRGHTAADSIRAVQCLKARGFETGVHLMAGLPGDNRKGFEATVEKTIDLRPDTVRIHPVLVFRNTELADMLTHGDYRPLELDEAIDLCRYALQRFRANGIQVIRLGLQTTDAMQEDGAIVAGPFHPAFRSLVEGAIFYDLAAHLLQKSDIQKSLETKCAFRVAPQDLSDFRGIGNRNMMALRERFGGNFAVLTDDSLRRGEVVLEMGKRIHTLHRDVLNSVSETGLETHRIKLRRISDSQGSCLS